MNRSLKRFFSVISVLSLVLSLFSPLSGAVRASADGGVTRDWGKVHHSGGVVTDYNGYTFMDGSYITDVQARGSVFEEKWETVNHDDSFFGFDWVTIEAVTEESAKNWNAVVLVPYGQVFSAEELARNNYYFVTSMSGSSVFTRFDVIERIGVGTINFENQGVTDPAAPSGAYNVVAIENVPGTKTAYLHFSTDLIRYSNYTDGGYVSDEAYGVGGFDGGNDSSNKVKLNPQIYVGGELRDNQDFNIVIKNENGKPVAPGEMVPADGVYYATVRPKDSLGKERFKYGFPEWEAYALDDDGNLLIDIMGLEANTAVTGTVKDNNGNILSGITVSISQKAGGWVSQTCISDEEGNFTFEGLYDYTDYTVSVNEGEYEPYSSRGTAPEPGEIGYCDIWLEHITPLVTVKIDTGKVDEFLCQKIYDAMQENLELVVDDGHNSWPETYTLVNVDGSFSVCRNNSEALLFDTGNLSIHCDAFEDVKVPITFFDEEVLEISVKPYGFIRAELTPAEPVEYAEYVCVVLDALGYQVDSQLVKQNAEGKYIFELMVKNSGTYSIVAYENSPDYQGESFRTLRSTDDFRYFQSDRFEVETGKTTSLTEPMIVPCAPLTLISHSTFTSNTTITDDGVRIKLNAHLELENAARASALYILVSPEETTTFDDLGNYALVNGNLVDKSLVINGKTVPMDTSMYAKTGMIIVPEFELPADISFCVDDGDCSSCYITLAADLTMADGKEKTRAIAGKTYVEVDLVTLEVPEKAASDEIILTGRAPAGKEVKIYDNDSLIGKTDTNNYGYYEALVTLKGTNEGYRSIHKVKAVCGNRESNTEILIYDEHDCALQGLWLTDEKGGTLSNPVVWSSSSVFAARADIANIDKLKEVSFIVTCSNGTVVELAEAGRTNEYVYSVSYPFGEKNLIPTELYLSMDIEEPTKHDIVDIAYELDHNSKFIPWSEPLKSKAIKAQGFKNNGFVLSVKESTADSESIFKKSEFRYNVSCYEATADEIRAEDARGAYSYHAQGNYTNGKKHYDGYISFDENGGLYALIEYDTNGQVVSAQKILVQNGNETGTNTELISGAMQVFSAEYGIKNSNLALMDEGPYTDASVGNNFSSTAAPQLADYYLSTLPKNETTRSFGQAGFVGAADSIYSTGKLGYECYNRNAECDENLSDVRARRELAQLLEDSGIINGNDMKKAINYYNSAESGYARARETNTDTFKTHVGATIVNTVAEEAGPVGKALGTGGNFFTSMVTDDMTVNVEVIKSEAGYDRTLGNKYFAMATGLSQDEINNFLANSNDPVARNAFINKIRSNSSENSKNSKKIQAIVDPSGYIYEAVASNRIEGASVAIYDEYLNLWEAYNYGQDNPLISDEEGKYSWDVPEGNWYVEASKEGYETNNSGADPAAVVSLNGTNFLPVLPPQLDVNIGLTDYSKPEFMVYSGDTAKELIVSSDKYMYTDSFISGITVYEGGKKLTYGTDYTAEYMDAEVSPAHTPVCGGSELARTVRLVFNSELSDYGIEITATTYAGTVGKHSQGRLAEEEQANPSDEYKEDITDEEYEGDDLADEEEDDEDEKSNAGIIVLVIVLLLAGGGAGFYFFKKKSNLQEEK